MDLDDLQSRRGKKGRFHLKSYHQDLSDGGQKKEVMFKVASTIKKGDGKNALKSVAQSFDYITRNGEKFEDEFISPEDEMGNKLTLEEMNELRKKWELEFNENEKEKARLMTHFVLSVDEKPTKKNIKKFDNATRDFLRERFGKEGYEYIYVIHTDNDKPHAHVIIKNHNIETNKKFRMDREWFLDSRIMAKEKLNEQGFNYKATLKRDRVFKKENLKTKGNEQNEVEQKGVELLEFGSAPYQFDEENKPSYYVSLGNGSTIWGIGLEEAITDAKVKIGDKITVRSEGHKDVVVDNKDGEKITAQRVHWIVEKNAEIEKTEKIEKEPEQKKGARVSDWFDAQLKKVARNDEHYEQLQEWKQILFEAKKNYTDRKSLKEAKQQIIDLEAYSKKNASPAAFAKVVRESGLTKEQINKARAKVKKRANHQNKKLDAQIRSSITELVRTEIAIGLSGTIEAKEKATMLNVIEQRKRLIDPYDKANSGAIKSRLMKEANFSKELDKNLAETRKVYRSRQPDEKALHRMFRQTSTASLSEGERKVFDKELSKTLDEVESKGVAAWSIYKKWQAQKHISEKIATLPQRLDKLDNQESQKLINAISKQIEKVATSKRDEIRMQKSLENAQRELDKTTQSNRSKIDIDVKKQLISIKSYDKKIDEAQEHLAKRQLFAMSKAYVAMKDNIEQLSRHDRQSIAPKLEKLESELVNRGANIGETRTRGSISHDVKRQHKSIEEVIKMERPPIERVLEAIGQANAAKGKLNETDMTVTERRETNKALNISRDQALLIKQARQQEFDNNMKELKKVSAKVAELQKVKTNSSTERYAINKQIGTLEKRFENTAKEVKRDIAIVGGTRAQFQVNREIIELAKGFSKSQGFTR
uniref:IncQ plasmid conjugative transfer DNA nicking endonuclease TraR (PTi VirD2-like protein) n=1 Tax=Enterovibrio norvegicus TaxID=188144 RepID=A0A0H4A2T2_9GAMM|nr:IncQ plasmid conjugative transfer DNA nicking endonuclease TraR (pTi VirD2 -like protein) [Enterovibrio norvegicus]